MALIRASCDTCGDVELSPVDLKVLVCSHTNEASYAFRCPRCGIAVSKPAERTVVDILVAVGVSAAVWQLPAELEEDHHGPPINHDDLLDFHFELQGDDWDRELRGLEQPSTFSSPACSPTSNPPPLRH